MKFVNLRHVKLARAVSCESVVSETSETENWEATENGLDRKIEIPDIKAWLKNPTDFIKFPTGKLNDENVGESKASSDELPSDSESNFAQIMISMSYLPTAERLSVVIVRVRIPKVIATEDDEVCVPKMIYVKAYLVDDDTGKRTCKKKTSLKQFEQSTGNQTIINFNELMIFKLPINKLSKTAVRVSVTGLGLGGVVSQQDADEARITSIGFVVLGSSSPVSSGVSHFATMTNTMRKPITMWHTLQR
ncbi:hypothetical protein B4U80_12820 [Leptotrombidium deliense]|uniref:C2 domain-containing protein n=1 Tax=Leptotrombidium deliense TaxID=299467 RepID=A0A443SKJ6_9ACAR|nr:hypothetical protein B4U80_12820 [Leptotrombidium deliense]